MLRIPRLDFAIKMSLHRSLSSLQLYESLQNYIVNRCLELVLKNGVRKLEIDIENSSESPYASANPMQTCRLPNMLLSVSVLESLNICGCELPSSLMVDVVQFKSLTRLRLRDVHIDDEVIKYLTTSCPLLQEFHVSFCYGFKRFCVYGHQNLQRVEIYYTTQLERIDIEAPNLSSLLVADMAERGAPQMNLASCKKLITVTYIGHPLPDDFLSNFPFVENLCLVTKYNNNLKWSSHSLRTLVLQSDCDLEGIEFSTPNLDLFIYDCDSVLHWPMIMDKRRPLLRDSTRLKACMQCYPKDYINTLWFLKLRRFLGKNNGFKVLNLYIHPTYSRKFKELEKLKAIKLPPYELEHVELQLVKCEESSAYMAFVDAVLWCCRPRSLTLRSFHCLTDFEEQNKVAKFACKKLLKQEDQGHTKIEIVWLSSSEAQKHLRDLKSPSMALPREGNAISFIKEEVSKQSSKKKLGNGTIIQEEARQWNSQR